MNNCFWVIILVLSGLFAVPETVEARQQKHFTIMGIGDSITEGGDAFESYICPLWELLYGAGYDFCRFYKITDETGEGFMFIINL